MDDRARKAAEEILGRLRSIDWSASNEDWKADRVAEIIERHYRAAQTSTDDEEEFYEVD